MDMGAISAAISGFNAITDISKSMVGIRDASIINSKVIELQGAVLSAQSSAMTAQSDQFAMLNRIRDLEKEVAQAEAWLAQKERYELHEIRDGLFTYVLKDSEQGTEPPHQLCANCFDIHNRKSILQQETRNPGRHQVLICHACNNDIHLTGARR